MRLHRRRKCADRMRSWGSSPPALFTAAGLEADKADCMGRLLLLTDMMGRRTHGLAQCAPYLEQLADGGR